MSGQTICHSDEVLVMRLELKTGARGNPIRRVTPQTPADVELLRAIAKRAQLIQTDRLAARQRSQGGAAASAARQVTQ